VLHGAVCSSTILVKKPCVPGLKHSFPRDTDEVSLAKVSSDAISIAGQPTSPTATKKDVKHGD
jgi:hypothetical protein